MLGGRGRECQEMGTGPFWNRRFLMGAKRQLRCSGAQGDERKAAERPTFKADLQRAPPAGSSSVVATAPARL